MKISEKGTIETNGSFTSLIFLDGEAEVKWNEGSFNAKKGDSVFVPAGMEVKIKGNAELLYAYV